MIIRACTGSWTCGVSGRSCRKGTGPTEDEFKYGVETLAITACAAETVHVHISENDRGTPGTGQVPWDSLFDGLKNSGYNGYLTIEAFGSALPALAAATRVWRSLFLDAMDLCRDGLAFMKKHAS